MQLQLPSKTFVKGSKFEIPEISLGIFTSNNKNSLQNSFFDRRYSRASNNASRSQARQGNNKNAKTGNNSPTQNLIMRSSKKSLLQIQKKDSSQSTTISSNQFPSIQSKNIVVSKPSAKEFNDRYFKSSEFNITTSLNNKIENNQKYIKFISKEKLKERKYFANKLKTSDFLLSAQVLEQSAKQKVQLELPSCTQLNEKKDKTLEEVLIEAIDSILPNEMQSLSSSSCEKTYSRIGQPKFEFTHANMTSPIKSVNKRANFLEGHHIQEEHRARMVDWMIQVYRVLKISNPQTFFLSTSIMDRYFEARNRHQKPLDKSDLHKIGLVSILISSKYEDVFPIRMSQILQDAGHNKFNQQQILDLEVDVLQHLGFKVQSKNIYEESSIILKKVLYEFKKATLQPKEQEFLFTYHLFLCQLTLHVQDLVLESLNVLSPALVYVSLKYVLQFYKKKLALKKMEARKDSEIKNQQLFDQNFSQTEQEVKKSKQLQKNIKGLLKIIGTLRSLFRLFKVQYIHHTDQEKQIRTVKSNIMSAFVSFQSRNFKNLNKNFPIFLEEPSLALLAE
eukprot:403362738